MAAPRRVGPCRGRSAQDLIMSNPNLVVTSAAAKFMRQMVRFSKHPAGGFRLTVAPGGCSGHSSEFTVEAGPHAGDAELAVDGLRLFLPATSQALLEGATVDFADTPLQSGLTFVTPNAAACCASAGEAKPPAMASIAVATIRRR
jgi:iron-sulfur cluster assembly accessory protein